MPRRLKTHTQRLREQHPQPRRRPSSWSLGYDTTWRRLRRSFLARHPLCAHCAREGRTAAAVDVDHIVPLRWGGARLDERNLQPLCKRCHSRKTAAELRPGGRGGQIPATRRAGGVAPP